MNVLILLNSSPGGGDRVGYQNCEELTQRATDEVLLGNISCGEVQGVIHHFRSFIYVHLDHTTK